MNNYEKELEKNKMAIQCYAGLVEVSLPKQLRGKHFSNIDDLYDFILLSQKEHELLESYREYHIVQENSEFYKRLYTSLLESNRDYHDDYLSYKRCEEDKDKIIERIMKLEEELKVKENE